MNAPLRSTRRVLVGYGLKSWLIGILVLGTSPTESFAADAAKSRPFHFETDIVSILSRFGCNSSGCHGKAEGQNGFKLSIFGFDPNADHIALTSESRGRRTNPNAPEKSLLLQKSCGDVPHGGGVRIRKDSDEYRVLRDWIANGLPFGEPTAPRVTSPSSTTGLKKR
jgi:hypothetical protein